MQASVKQYAAEVQRTKGVPIQIRVGLNSGEVVVRAIGSDLHMAYTAVGQTTHLAARMEQMAMPGSILITPGAFKLAEGYIQVKTLGPVPIKGMSAPVEVSEVTGAGHVRTLDEAMQDTIPALLALLDVLPEDSRFQQLEPPQRRQRTLDVLKRVLVRQSQTQPLLLVFEDLHWIDSETQTLLDSLVESLLTARLLVVVNYRPEYQHSWGSKTYCTQLRLDPLRPASADKLLHALLGEEAGLQKLKHLLIVRTEGNPFFLEGLCPKTQDWERKC
jgi:Adenylate and Guanylate cyclase catalytic domain/AAA ATPase domain